MGKNAILPMRREYRLKQKLDWREKGVKSLQDDEFSKNKKIRKRARITFCIIGSVAASKTFY